jgi:hypothetical protein
MGEGIVTSVDNFGTSGAPPTNPALLDQLALDFIQHDWSIKYLVREIVLSHTYQQSSQWRQTPHEIDPENQLWWRAKPRALEAEELRDGLLAISGSLDRERPHGSLIALAGDGAIGGRRLGGISEADIASAESSHRSLYLPVPRGILPDALEIFDFADNSAVSGKRELTIVPSQSLYWMNSSFVENECEKLAEQTLNELFGTTARSSSDPPASAGRPLGPRRLQAVARWLLTDRTPVGGNQSLPTLTSNEIESAFSKLTRVILSRPPLPDELQATLTYVLESQDKGHAQTKIWTGVCRSLFSSADYRLLR